MKKYKLMLPVIMRFTKFMSTQRFADHARAIYSMDGVERLERIKKSYANPDFTEEEHIRIGFAIERHKKNIERLKLLIQRAKDDPAQLYLKKN